MLKTGNCGALIDRGSFRIRKISYGNVDQQVDLYAILSTKIELNKTITTSAVTY